VLLYTPANEHFGIVPVEAMCAGLPVLACDSGGPTESVLDPGSSPVEDMRTGWLRPPEPDAWAGALEAILSLSRREREALAVRARARARSVFGMGTMAKGLEQALQEAVDMGRVRVAELSGGWVVWWLLGLVILLLGYSIG